MLARVVTFWIPLVLSAVTTAVLVSTEDDVVPDDLGIVSRMSGALQRVRD